MVGEDKNNRKRKKYDFLVVAILPSYRSNYNN